MARKGEKVSRYSEKEDGIVGEAGDPIAPKMRRIMEEQEEESHLKTSVIAKRKGATVSLKAQESMVEGDPTITKGSQKWEPRKDAASDKSTCLNGTGASSGNPVSHEKLNSDIKHQLMKEIRQFGRKYGRIFQLLEDVQGPLDVKTHLFEFTIKEAARFKRRHLIQCLEEKREEILSHSPLSNNDPPVDM